MSVTRRTHVVRIKNPNDNGMTYVDVEVLDAVALLTPSGDEALFEVMAEAGEFDNLVDSSAGAADTGGAGSGGEERLYDTSFGNVIPYIVDHTGDGNAKGIASHCTRASHMIRLTSTTDSTQFFDAEVLDAFTLRGPNGSEVLLNMPAANAVSAVTDNTGNGLGVQAVIGKTTRAQHIVEIYNALDTPEQQKTDSKFLLVARTDKVAFLAPNGHEFLLSVPNSTDTSNTNDTTVYVTDPATGEDDMPPPNNDPDPYVIFPKNSGGPFLGKSPAVDQGLLWWIKKAGYLNNQWYWYIPVQQPKDFSFFAFPPPEDADPSWSYNGFYYWGNYPVVWILSANTPIVPIPEIGFASLEDAILASPESHDAPGFLPDGNDNSNFGEFTLTLPPIPQEDFEISAPNIWQLTGIQQPPLKDPTKSYDAETNPYAAPSPALAAQVVQQFLKFWNDTSSAADGELASWATPSFDSDTRPSAPPLWPWATPWHTNFEAGYFFNFQAGLGTGTWSGGIPLELLSPYASPQFLAIGQLDPTKWNTTVYPPVLWPA